VRIVAERYLTADPSDVRGLAEALESGRLDPHRIVAAIGKTEGNGGRNDFTRALAVNGIAECIGERTGESRQAVLDRVVCSFSGGCEGVASPHLLVLAYSGVVRRVPRDTKRLALAVGYTRAFRPAECGRMAMIEETARVVRELMAETGIEVARDVHLVQIKGAIPAGGAADDRADMVYSRGASALGVALALGEVDAADLSDTAVCADWSLYSGVASVSSKPGLERSEIVLVGNSPYWEGDLRIAHGVMRDIIDIEAIRGVLSELGLEADGQLTPEQTERLVGVFAKSDADPRHAIRGRRHTMWTDDDISDMRYSRGVVAAQLAGVTGETAVYVSTRAEHHGPLGGGPVAIIARDTPAP